MPDCVVRVLPSLRVREGQPAHEVGQLPLFSRPQHEVPVVGHQAPVQDADRHPLVRLDQDALEGDKVLVLLEQPQPAVGPVEHVIHQPAGDPSCDAGHGRER